MLIAIVTFVIFFSLVAIGLILAFNRETVEQRLQAILDPHKHRDLGPAAASTMRQAATTFGVFAESVQKVVPKSEEDVSAIRKRLIRGGFRGDNAPNVLFALKALVPALFCAIVFFTGAYHWNALIVFGLALVFGYLLPDFVLDHIIQNREDELRVGLPDVIDLLVVCLEAGLSLDQAVLRASDEMRDSHPALSDELGLVMLDVRAGRPRAEAWKRFADRTDMDVTRLLVSIFVQADQYGTGISKTMRVHADGMRVRRRQRLEEMAAKTHVKLVFPLVLFIFPSLFIVTLGPAFILMAEAFHK
jgi:tight adherence protein C